MLSPRQYERSKRLQVDDNWTRTIRELYPPAERASVVVAFDPVYRGGRWVLAYDTSDVTEAAGAFAQVRYLKAFYVWQGPGQTFLHPSAVIADWLRDHDTHSEHYTGEWEDRMFGDVDKAKEQAEKAYWDEMTYGLKQVYDRHGKEIRASHGTFSHHNGRGPNNGSKYFLPSKAYGGWKQ